MFYNNQKNKTPCFFRPAIFGYEKRQTQNGTKNPGSPPIRKMKSLPAIKARVN
jgi:hypothetical protein